MTRDRFDLVALHCGDLGIEIEWRDMGPKRRGLCVCLDNKIVLNPRMTAAQAAATGVHELAHHIFGDVVSSPSQERRAWRYGASLLIEPWEYREAEEFVGSHPNALAAELGVTPRLIQEWRAWWETARWSNWHLDGVT